MQRAARRRNAQLPDEQLDLREAQEPAVTVAAGQLRSFIERVERLAEERKTISEDIAEIYAEMKGDGFDTKAVRALIRLRAMNQTERQVREAVLDLYKAALGMV